MEKLKAFPLLKMCRLSRVYILAKGALGCDKRVLLQKENPHARLPRTRTKTTLTIIYLSRLSVGSSKGFSKASATDDFDLLILRPVYILIMNGELLVPFPVALVVDLREIKGRTPKVLYT